MRASLLRSFYGSQQRKRPSEIFSIKGLTLEWSGVRVAEGARLESVYTETYRGFESLPDRHLYV